jgi:archaemetzincin
VQHINLISFGPFEADFMNSIAESVRQEFMLDVVIREGHLDLSEFFDPNRRQYDGNDLIRQVDLKFSGDSLKTFGLFSVDLFIPILTYIFGQAFLGGHTGIASVFRLNNERYGLPPDRSLLLNRCVKEVVHELGHTFGLIHCHVPLCVMTSSTYVEDIDQKDASFCPHCRAQLEQH